MISAITDTVFIDYRPLRAKLSGLQAVGGDVTRLPLRRDSVESLSCLHVIEHIGLGRYGDPIDTGGASKAAQELERVLQPGGLLYLSTPVGRERVYFNAHRVFAPATVIRLFPGLVLKEFSFVDDHKALQNSLGLEAASECEYACGMFVLEKPITI
jgi:SAM-dependent methyltransferase